MRSGHSRGRRPPGHQCAGTRPTRTTADAATPSAKSKATCGGSAATTRGRRMTDDLFSATQPPKAVDGIRAGIGGWTFVPWRNNFYPSGLVQRRELEYASRHVSAIEINGTYYGTQTPATYARWRDETPEGVVFSAKAPKRIRD